LSGRRDTRSVAREFEKSAGAKYRGAAHVSRIAGELWFARTRSAAFRDLRFEDVY
jgi:hypothetical protein